LGAIRAQSLRTFLTIMIIALGICALVGILTAIDVIKGSFTNNFTTMGANTFNIRNRESNVRIGGRRKKREVYRPISYAEASEFKKTFSFSPRGGISCFGTQIATIKFGSLKTNPNIAIFGGDENYMITSGYELAEGRNFSMREIESGAEVAIIGQEVKRSLFPKQLAVDKEISIGGRKAKVIGVFKEKGSSFGFGGDKMLLMPLLNVNKHYGSNQTSFVVNVLSPSPQMLDAAISEATGLFRQIRKIKIKDPQNFEITRSDNLSVMLIDNLQYVTVAATLIAIITLLGAAIGLMNIMLVSVSERTGEIGLRKAIGAREQDILLQFLIESTLVSIAGGAFGILFGAGAIVLVSSFSPLAATVSASAVALSLSVSTGIGLFFGVFPAYRASKWI